MNEYLMIAHEIEKARSLARKERSSPTGSPPEGHMSTNEGRFFRERGRFVTEDSIDHTAQEVLDGVSVPPPTQSRRDVVM
jgi:hypothetical protein